MLVSSHLSSLTTTAIREHSYWILYFFSSASCSFVSFPCPKIINKFRQVPSCSYSTANTARRRSKEKLPNCITTPIMGMMLCWSLHKLRIGQTCCMILGVGGGQRWQTWISFTASSQCVAAAIEINENWLNSIRKHWEILKQRTEKSNSPFSSLKARVENSKSNSKVNKDKYKKLMSCK